jgi:hypothetical protein
MTKRKMRIAFITIFSLIAILFLTRVIVFDCVTISQYDNDIMEEYKGYYLSAKNVKPLVDFSMGEGNYGKTKVWFLFGQKRALMVKLQQDVIGELDNVINNNNDLFQKYEISDDFKTIKVFINNETKENQRGKTVTRQEELKNNKSIVSKVYLHYELVHGYKPGGIGDIIEYVEVEVKGQQNGTTAL